MGSNQREPCLTAPHNRSAASLASSRLPSFGAAVIFVLWVLLSPVEAQTRDPQQAALDDFVAARMLTTKCPSWQINLAEARARFAQLNLHPADWQGGGRHARFFDERLSYYANLLSRMSETRACTAAEEAFGPAGRVTKGWMRRQ